MERMTLKDLYGNGGHCTAHNAWKCPECHAKHREQSIRDNEEARQERLNRTPPERTCDPEIMKIYCPNLDWD